MSYVFLLISIPKLAERVAKLANKTHKDRVSEFNAHLESLSEHHDIPKVRCPCQVALALTHISLRSVQDKTCSTLLHISSGEEFSGIPCWPCCFFANLGFGSPFVSSRSFPLPSYILLSMGRSFSCISPCLGSVESATTYCNLFVPFENNQV